MVLTPKNSILTISRPLLQKIELTYHYCLCYYILNFISKSFMVIGILCCTNVSAYIIFSVLPLGLCSAPLCPTLGDPLDCSLTRLLRPQDFSVKNTGVVCHFLLQGIFPTQGLNPRLLSPLDGRRILYCWAVWEAHLLARKAYNIYSLILNRESLLTFDLEYVYQNVNSGFPQIFRLWIFSFTYSCYLHFLIYQQWTCINHVIKKISYL